MKSAIASLEIYVFAAEAPPGDATAPGVGAAVRVDSAEDPGAAAVASPAANRAAEPGLDRGRSFGRPRRLSLVIGAPERTASGDAWQCRVVLADLHRPQTLEGRDSMEALLRAVGRARGWLEALRAEGLRLYRDRAGAEPLELP